MPLRKPQMLHFTQHLILLLLYDTARGSQRGRLKTLSAVWACYDVSVERNTDAAFLCSR